MHKLHPVILTVEFENAAIRATACGLKSRPPKVAVSDFVNFILENGIKEFPL